MGCVGGGDSDGSCCCDVGGCCCGAGCSGGNRRPGIADCCDPVGGGCCPGCAVDGFEEGAAGEGGVKVGAEPGSCCSDGDGLDKA